MVWLWWRIWRNNGNPSAHKAVDATAILAMWSMKFQQIIVITCMIARLQWLKAETDSKVQLQIVGVAEAQFAYIVSDVSYQEWKCHCYVLGSSDRGFKPSSVDVVSHWPHPLSPEPSMTALAASQLLGSPFKSLQIWPAAGSARTLLYIVPWAAGSIFFVVWTSPVWAIGVAPSADVVGGEVRLLLAWPDCGRAVMTSNTSLSCMSAAVGESDGTRLHTYSDMSWQIPSSASVSRRSDSESGRW